MKIFLQKNGTKKLTLISERPAKPFALLLGLVSVGITFAASVNESLTPTTVAVIEISSNVTITRARFDRLETGWTESLGLRRDRPLRSLRLRPLLPTRTFLTALLAALLVVEAVLVALAATVVELVTTVGTSIVVPLNYGTVAWSNQDWHRARI